jgi:hypothetical protein
MMVRRSIKCSIGRVAATAAINPCVNGFKITGAEGHCRKAL